MQGRPEAPPADSSSAAASQMHRAPPPPYGEQTSSPVSAHQGPDHRGHHPVTYSPARSDRSLSESQGSHSPFRPSPLNPSTEFGIHPVPEVSASLSHELPPRDSWNNYLSSSSGRGHQGLPRADILWGPPSTPLSPSLPLTPNRRNAPNSSPYSSLPSPSPSSLSSSSSSARRSGAEDPPREVLFYEGHRPITIADIRTLQHENLSLKEAQARLLQQLLVAQADYAEAGYALDSIYSGHAFDNFASDRPEGKRCSYRPIHATISTRCSKENHAPGTCTHPPWSGTLVIDQIILQDEMSYFNAIWERAKVCLWGRLQRHISSIVSSCHNAWDKAHGDPWGERPRVNVGRLTQTQASS